MKDAAEIAVFAMGGVLAGLIALFMLTVLFILAKSAIELFEQSSMAWRFAVLISAGAGVVGALYWHATLVPR